MRVPIRKPGKYTHQKPDHHLTPAKFEAFKKEFDTLSKTTQPHAIAEVKRLAEMGDFSENAAYQMAKSRLRGINQRLIELEEYLKRAKIITPSANTETVATGHHVTVMMSGKERTLLILGSSETDPVRGIISHHSPIGAALIGRRVGDKVAIDLGDHAVECEILKIEA